MRKATADINTALAESISGAKEINLFGAVEKNKSQFEEYNQNYLSAFLKVVHSYSLYFPLIEIVANCGMLLILFYAHFTLGITVHIGEIFAFFSYINMFFRPIREMAEKFNVFQSALAASERIFKLKDVKSEIISPVNPYPLVSPFRGNIHFDDVSFAYKSGLPVIRKVTFNVSQGEKVAIVGYTGSGKTTIINLLNRLYDIDSGSILVDGVDIRQYDLAMLRKLIAVVPQDLFLFTGTIAENISLHKPDVTRDDIQSAAVAIGADTFINELPEKYDENVLEEGKLLSTGQRQLLGFARALVSKPEIVILDEATANIDSGTEKILEQATNTLLENRTAIIIAHRLSTIKAVDRILVLHKGKLVEEGNHSDLLEKNGLYKQLYEIQAFS